MSSNENRTNRHKSEEELWSKKFSDSAKGSKENQNSRVGRSNTKKMKEDGVSPWLTGAVLLLALLFIAPITYTMWLHNRDAKEFSKEDEPNIEVVEEKKDKKEKKEKDKKEKKEDSEKAQEEKPESQPESKPEEKPAEPESNPEPEPEPEPEPQPQPEPEPEPSGSTYTVQPGDTLYRIATNNGTTVDQLMAINGLSSPDISAGQVLRLQ